MADDDGEDNFQYEDDGLGGATPEELRAAARNRPDTVDDALYEMKQSLADPGRRPEEEKRVYSRQEVDEVFALLDQYRELVHTGDEYGERSPFVRESYFSPPPRAKANEPASRGDGLTSEPFILGFQAYHELRQEPSPPFTHRPSISESKRRAVVEDFRNWQQEVATRQKMRAKERLEVATLALAIANRQPGAETAHQNYRRAQELLKQERRVIRERAERLAMDREWRHRLIRRARIALLILGVPSNDEHFGVDATLLRKEWDIQRQKPTGVFLEQERKYLTTVREDGTTPNMVPAGVLTNLINQEVTWQLICEDPPRGWIPQDPFEAKVEEEAEEILYESMEGVLSFAHRANMLGFDTGRLPDRDADEAARVLQQLDVDRGALEIRRVAQIPDRVREARQVVSQVEAQLRHPLQGQVDANGIPLVPDAEIRGWRLNAFDNLPEGLRLLYEQSRGILSEFYSSEMDAADLEQAIQNLAAPESMQSREGPVLNRDWIERRNLLHRALILRDADVLVGGRGLYWMDGFDASKWPGVCRRYASIVHQRTTVMLRLINAGGYENAAEYSECSLPLDVAASDREGNTLLWHATSRRMLGTVNGLVRKGANPNLSVAIQSGFYRNRGDARLYGPFELAVRNGFHDCAAVMLVDPGYFLESRSGNRYKFVASRLIAINEHSQKGYAPVHHAAAGCYPETIRLLLMFGADPDCLAQHHQERPLRLCFLDPGRSPADREATVAALIEAGADPSRLDPVGLNLLTVATGESGLAVDSIEALIRMRYTRRSDRQSGEMETFRLNPMAEDPVGTTPLHNAVMLGRGEVVDLYMRLERDEKLRRDNRMRPFKMRPQQGDDPRWFDATNRFGMTPLSLSVIDRFSSRSLRTFLMNGANPDTVVSLAVARGAAEEMSLLMLALEKGVHRNARVLLEAGARVDTPVYSFISLIRGVEHTIEGSRAVYGMTRRLIRTGAQLAARVPAVSLIGWDTALHYAASKKPLPGFFRALEKELRPNGVLLAQRFDVNTRDRHGRTMLHAALWQSGHGLDIDPALCYLGIRELLRLPGLDLEAKDARGATPLLYAASYNRDGRYVRMLIEAGARVDTVFAPPVSVFPLDPSDIREQRGACAIHFAHNHKNVVAMRELLWAGAVYDPVYPPFRRTLLEHIAYELESGDRSDRRHMNMLMLEAALLLRAGAGVLSDIPETCRDRVDELLAEDALAFGQRQNELDLLRGEGRDENGGGGDDEDGDENKDDGGAAAAGTSLRRDWWRSHHALSAASAPPARQGWWDAVREEDRIWREQAEQRRREERGGGAPPPRHPERDELN